MNMVQNYSDRERFDSDIIDGLNITKRHRNAMICLNDWVEREHGGRCDKFGNARVLDIDKVVNESKLDNVSSTDTVIGLKTGNIKSLRLVEAKFGIKKHKAKELGSTALKDKYNGSIRMIRENGDTDIVISKRMDILVKKEMKDIVRLRIRNLTARSTKLSFVAMDIDAFFDEYFGKKE